MNRSGYASLESQLAGNPCLCEDTEEMFWLREQDDYASRFRLGNLLSEQYRFREAIDCYRSAEKIRADDSRLYLCLGGAYLTLFRFDDAGHAYRRCLALGGSVAYPMGVCYYLQGRYRAAADSFSAALPCGDEMKIAILYQHALCCLREGLPDRLIGSYREDMEVGHHAAYRSAVELFLGRVGVPEAVGRAEEASSDLDTVIILYGIAVYLESHGGGDESGRLLSSLLERRSVWPCIPYLCAWNDIRTANRNPTKEDGGNF